MPTIVAPEKVYTGMGATPHEAGVAFRVWAPHADAVYVVASFDDWAADAHPMEKEGDGYWYADLASASIGDEYRFRIVNSDWKGYSLAFGNQACSEVVAGAKPPAEVENAAVPERDGFPAEGTISIGPYSVLIFSQDNNP